MEVPEEETRAFRNETAEKWAQWRRDTHILPPATIGYLLGRSLPGSRNSQLYFAAVSLFEFGKTVDEARKILMKSPTSKNLSGFEDTLRSAAKRAGASYER